MGILDPGSAAGGKPPGASRRRSRDTAAVRFRNVAAKCSELSPPPPNGRPEHQLRAQMHAPNKHTLFVDRDPVCPHGVAARSRR